MLWSMITFIMMLPLILQTSLSHISREMLKGLSNKESRILMRLPCSKNKFRTILRRFSDSPNCQEL